MKTRTRIHFVIAALSFTFLSTTGCAQKQKTAEAPSPPPSATTTTIIPAAPVADALPPASVTLAAASWADIKDDTFDQRVHFFSGLKQLESILEGQIAELVAKRATMKGTTRTEEWDFAMKEMNTSRSYLKSVTEELNLQATPVTWTERKEKVGQAWVRTQTAYGKVKTSTTS